MLFGSQSLMLTSLSVTLTILRASGHGSRSFLDSFRAFYPWFSGHSDSRVGMECGLFPLWAVVAVFPAFPGPSNRT